MYILRKLINFFFWLFYGVCVVCMVVVGSSAQENSFLPFRSFIVTTGSMIPTIDPGAIVFTQKKAEYGLQDIVTFTSADKHVITHRIIEKRVGDAHTFVTKGDNNKTADSEPIAQSQIIGAVRTHIPFIGKILVHTAKPSVLFLFIALPILVIVGTELFKEKNQKA